MDACGRFAGSGSSRDAAGSVALDAPLGWRKVEQNFDCS
jgi:hypothetical protein